jgi:hypothetical protein
MGNEVKASINITNVRNIEDKGYRKESAGWLGKRKQQ